MSTWTIVTRLCARTLLSKSSNSRFYASKISRRPVRVLSNEELSGTQKYPIMQERDDEERDDDSEEEPLVLEGKPSRLPPGFPKYDKKGKDDTDLCRFALDTSCKMKRLKSGLIMLEGKRLINEALLANIKPKALFFSRVEDVTQMQLPPYPFLFQKVIYNKIKRWSKVDTSQGVIGFFELPDTKRIRPKSSLPFSIVCDNVRDPGNLGSIVRVAASAGCSKLMLTKGCVDLWNSKVLRASMGLHFRMCIEEDVQWENIEEQLTSDTFVIFADNKDIDTQNPNQMIRDDVYFESDLRSNDHTEKSESNEIPTNKTDINEESKVIQSLPMFSYFEVDYSRMNDIILVLGGETQGLSPEAVKFGRSHRGLRINIPMLNNVESLNVSSALAIITHEIKRQYTQQQMSEPENTMSLPSI